MLTHNDLTETHTYPPRNLTVKSDQSLTLHYVTDEQQIEARPRLVSIASLLTISSTI